jgi:MFS family permease
MIAMLSFAGSKLLASVVVMLYLDTWGRRTPLIAGLLLMFVSSGSLFMFFYDSLQKDNAFQWGFIVLLDLFVMGYEVSVGATTFVLLGEIFPGDIKAEAVSIAFVVAFTLSSCMIFLVYFEVYDIGYSVVWGQFSMTSFVFVFFAASLVPETKGKTLEQIQREFQQV